MFFSSKRTKKNPKLWSLKVNPEKAKQEAIRRFEKYNPIDAVSASSRYSKFTQVCL